MWYRKLSAFILYTGTFLFPSLLIGEGEDVLWKYGKDRYGRPALIEPQPMPFDSNLLEYIAKEKGYREWTSRTKRGPKSNVTVMAEKPENGKIFILGFHKIGFDKNFALTPNRFRRLLYYLKRNRWHMVSDHQYLSGDFTHVPTGFKPIVMGADDATYGTVVYKTRGDQLYGTVRRFRGKPLLDPNSMVAILEKLAQKEAGRINFTFYISFDGIPFRQLDGFKNPGFPYRGIPVVSEKIQYLSKNFIVGLHSLSHMNAMEMTPSDFSHDIEAAWNLITEYTGESRKKPRTLAYPYGSGGLFPEYREAVQNLNEEGYALAGAFNFDNEPALPLGKGGDKLNISRLNADNQHWRQLMKTLKSGDSAVVRREIIWETDSKRLPKSLRDLGGSSSDNVWILVRGRNSGNIVSHTAGTQ